MANINYTQEVYNLVVETKQYNEDYINELYANMGNFSINEKLIALQSIAALKEINIEYEKYIINYQYQISNIVKDGEYVVIQGDTLQSIALKKLGDITRWQEIYRLNNLSDVVLSPGDVLSIPE